MVLLAQPTVTSKLDIVGQANLGRWYGHPRLDPELVPANLVRCEPVRPRAGDVAGGTEVSVQLERFSSVLGAFQVGEPFAVPRPQQF